MKQTTEPDELKFDSAKDLGESIFAFLEVYGKKMPDSDEYNSPDGEELAAAACQLVNFGDLHRMPWSEFGQGGYKELHNAKVRARHDALIRACRPYVKV